MTQSKWFIQSFCFHCLGCMWHLETVATVSRTGTKKRCACRRFDLTLHPPMYYFFVPEGRVPRAWKRAYGAAAARRGTCDASRDFSFSCWVWLFQRFQTPDRLDVAFVTPHAPMRMRRSFYGFIPRGRDAFVCRQHRYLRVCAIWIKAQTTRFFFVLFCRWCQRLGEVPTNWLMSRTGLSLSSGIPTFKTAALKAFRRMKTR